MPKTAKPQSPRYTLHKTRTARICAGCIEEITAGSEYALVRRQTRYFTKTGRHIVLLANAGICLQCGQRIYGPLGVWHIPEPPVSCNADA